MQRLVPGWLNSHPLSIRWGLWVLTWGTNTARAGLAQLAPSVDPVPRQCNAAYSSAAQRAAARAPVRVYHYRHWLAVGSQWARLGSALCIERCALSMQRGANRPILDGTLYETIAAEFHRRRCRALLVAATN